MGDREVHKDLILGRSKKDPTASIKRRLKERTLPIVKGQEPGTSARCEMCLVLLIIFTRK